MTFNCLKKTRLAKAPSSKLDKLQAMGYYRIKKKGIIMEKITIDYRVSEHMKRVADALEELLRLVKEDQKEMRKIREEKD